MKKIKKSNQDGSASSSSTRNPRLVTVLLCILGVILVLGIVIVNPPQQLGNYTGTSVLRRRAEPGTLAGIQEGIQDLARQLEAIAKNQAADAEHEGQREFKLESLQEAIEATKKSQLIVQQQQQQAVPSTNLQQWQKYVTVYNYAPPWESFRAPHAECGEGPDFAPFFSQSLSKRSRYDEDKVVYEKFFKHKMTTSSTNQQQQVGTYIELGGFDGSTEANTRFYDVCLGWKGLLIEGNPTTFPKLRLERPQAHRISFAPSCSAEYEAVNKTVEFHAVIWANAGLEDSAMSYKGSDQPKVPVPCGPLSPVLEDIFPKERINFFSLDVEGAELMVLDTIDFTKVQIDIFMIEIQNNDCQAICPKRDKIRALMPTLGYKLYMNVVQKSDIWVHQDSPYQMT